MSKFRLAFGIHNHQPVGNFDHVFEFAHRNAYAPFLEALSRSGLSISLHQSGILWDWQEKHHPEYLQTVKAMVTQGRLELMTGGFYEPILISIPERDVQGQIKQLNDYLKKHFDFTPEGLWLTERIWEPHLPRQLQQAGVKFLPVDDTHFIYAGFEHSQLTGPFVTEHENYRVKLLPISKRMRYLVPFGTVDEVIDELKSHAEGDPSGMIIYADDGEKFGSWPQTHQHCYVDGWLSNFFEALARNSDWLEVVPLKTAADAKAVGRAYLPSASYAEMLHWSLPPTAFVQYENFEMYLKDHSLQKLYGRFVRGGHWRGFLAKYDEANLMHKKMMAVSERLASFKAKTEAEKKQLETARDHLYAGQCNCPYWHGVFGGLYLPHIRQAIFSNLVSADSILDKMESSKGSRISSSDYDADGSDEIIVGGEKLSAVFKPGRGGTLLELSINERSFSITDTLTRRREGYHLKLDQAVTPGSESKTASIHDLVLAKEEGLKELLTEDWYLKRCFIDHFFNGGVNYEAFHSGVFREDGDFVLEPYDSRIDKKSGSITLMRDGHLWKPEGVIPVRLVKTFAFNQDRGRIDVTYEMSCPGHAGQDVSFGLENNFNLQAGHDDQRFVLIDGERPHDSFLDTSAEHKGISSFAMVDSARDIAIGLECRPSGDLWRMPIFTVSLSEGGFEKVYQGTTLLNHFFLRLTDEPTVLHFGLVAGTVGQVTENLSTSAIHHK
ncbi:MAG: alpha-amylase/4-alpha-glucanotransferase domain-containing protein [Candidatus Zixiibacteriota bacterium]